MGQDFKASRAAFSRSVFRRRASASASIVDNAMTWVSSARDRRSVIVIDLRRRDIGRSSFLLMPANCVVKRSRQHYRPETYTIGSHTRCHSRTFIATVQTGSDLQQARSSLLLEGFALCKYTAGSTHHRVKVLRIVHALPIKLHQDRSDPLAFFRSTVNAGLGRDGIEDTLTGLQVADVKAVVLINLKRFHSHCRRRILRRPLPCVEIKRPACRLRSEAEPKPRCHRRSRSCAAS